MLEFDDICREWWGYRYTSYMWKSLDLSEEKKVSVIYQIYDIAKCTKLLARFSDVHWKEACKKWDFASFGLWIDS